MDGPMMQSLPTDGRGAPRVLERTGDEAVDRVLEMLEGLPPDAEPAEQASVLDAVHEQLQQRLSAADR